VKTFDTSLFLLPAEELIKVYSKVLPKLGQFDMESFVCPVMMPRKYKLIYDGRIIFLLSVTGIRL